MKPGDVIQIDPTRDKLFGSCFMMVTEVKSWGVVGYVEIPSKGRAYYRCATEDFFHIGAAHWVPEDEVEEEPI